MEIPQQYQRNLYGAALAFMIVLSLYFGMKFVSELRAFGTMGSMNVNTITLSGYGEVSAVPDVATVYFTIEKEGKTVKEAQDAVAVIEKKALDSLKENGVLEKDFKTSNASFYPKYEYQYDTRILMPCTQYDCPPRPGKNTITGYMASESITVKVRNTENVGKIMQDLGTLGVSQLSGPDFTIDNEEALQAEARKKAIDEAKEKAKVLAKDLGVRLGRVVTFSEGGYYPMPMYAKAEAMGVGGDSVSAPAEIPKGENIISSSVTITYEIR